MYQSYFWDLDGTLYDTYPQMVNAFAKTLSHFKVEPEQTTIYNMMRQTNLGATFDYYSDQTEIKCSDLEAIYYPLEKRLQQPQLFPGVRELLQRIVQNGGHNYLLTHRNNSAMEFITQDGIKQLFTDFVTAAQPFPRKPDPTSLNYLINKYKVERAHAVMVGDRNLDIEAGHNAGIAGILFDPDDLIEASVSPERRIKEFNVLSFQ